MCFGHCLRQISGLLQPARREQRKALCFERSLETPSRNAASIEARRVGGRGLSERPQAKVRGIAPHRSSTSHAVILSDLFLGSIPVPARHASPRSARAMRGTGMRGAHAKFPSEGVGAVRSVRSTPSFLGPTVRGARLCRQSACMCKAQAKSPRPFIPIGRRNIRLSKSSPI